MSSYNKVILIGNLTRDPVMSYLPSQTPVTEFGIATNRNYKGKDGEMKEDVCFVDCRAYGREAENITQYCKKGSPLLIEGRLTFDQWDAQDGSKRSKHRIFVERFQFVSEAQSGGGRGGSAGSQGQPDSQFDKGYAPDDNIPF